MHPQNILKVYQLGIAEYVDFHSFTIDELRDKLLSVLEKPQYSENVKRLSNVFRDQKDSPLERAVWWIEWALRNPQTNDYKCPVNELGQIIGNSYDLVALIVFVATLICLWILRKLLYLLQIWRGFRKFLYTGYRQGRKVVYGSYLYLFILFLPVLWAVYLNVSVFEIILSISLIVFYFYFRH